MEQSFEDNGTVLTRATLKQMKTSSSVSQALSERNNRPCGSSSRKKFQTSSVPWSRMNHRKRKYEDADAEPAAMKPPRPVPACNECEQRDSKYRCPLCYARYCSKECYKIHKTHCEEEEPSSTVSPSKELVELTRPHGHDNENSSQASTSVAIASEEDKVVEKENEEGLRPKYEYTYPSEDTVPLDKLMAVKDDSRVNEMLENPKLRALIKKIDETKDPKTSFAEVMQHPEFCAFSNLVLQIIGMRDKE